jgi:hypothetical protein
MDTASGSALARELAVDATPTMVVRGADGTELWRQTAEADPGTMRATLLSVLEGTRTWGALGERWRTGHATGAEVVEFVEHQFATGDRAEGRRLASAIVSAADRFSEDTRCSVSLLVAEYANDQERIGLLREHLARCPTDMVARLNFGYALVRTSQDPPETRRQVARVAAMMSQSSDVPPHVIRSARRLIADYVLAEAPQDAAWALPHAEHLFESEPSDLSSLSLLVALASLAGDDAAIEGATAKARAADSNAASASIDRIAAAVTSGRRRAREIVESQIAKPATP